MLDGRRLWILAYAAGSGSRWSIDHQMCYIAEVRGSCTEYVFPVRTRRCFVQRFKFFGCRLVFWKWSCFIIDLALCFVMVGNFRTLGLLLVALAGSFGKPRRSFWCLSRLNYANQWSFNLQLVSRPESRNSFLVFFVGRYVLLQSWCSSDSHPFVFETRNCFRVIMYGLAHVITRIYAWTMDSDSIKGEKPRWHAVFKALRV